MKRNKKSGWFGLCGKIALTIAFFLLANRSLTKGDLAPIVASITPLHVATAIGLGIVGLWFQVFRWQIVLKHQLLPSDPKIAWKTMLLGSLYGFLTPGRVGELARGLDIDPSRRADSVIAVMLDRLYAIITALLFGLIGMMLQLMIYKTPVNYYLAIPLVLSFTGIIFAYFVIPKSKEYRTGINKIDQLLGKIHILIPAATSLIGKRILFFSIAAQVALIAQTMVLFDMFGSHGWLANLVSSCQSYTFMIFLPFFIANVGIREYSFSLFLGSVLNQSITIKSISLGAGTTILAINILMPAICGLIWLLIDKKIFKSKLAYDTMIPELSSERPDSKLGKDDYVGSR